MSTPLNSAESLLQQLEARSRVGPPADNVLVLLGPHAVGWARPAIARALGSAGLAQHDDAGLHLPQHPAALHAAARCLLETGHLKGWRHEALDILDANDTPLAQIERATMRALGLRTRAVHLQALGPDGRIWVARRAEHKSTDPGLWDTLVGGLVGAGETPERALLRESNEEAGLHPADLAKRQLAGAFTVRRTVPEGYQVESTHVWVCQLPEHCAPANRDGEVSAIELITAAEALQAIDAGQFTLEAALSILHWLTRAAPDRARTP